MHHRCMPNRAPIADIRAVVVREMHDRIVLNIRALADPDLMNISPQDGAIKHAALRAQHYIAMQRRVGRDKQGLLRIGSLPEMSG